MPRMVEVFGNVSEDDSEKRRRLWNVFSKTFSEFRYRVTKAADYFYGKDWKKRIASSFGKDELYVDRAVRKLWDNNYTDYESVGEIGFWFDVAQNDPDGYGGEISVHPAWDMSLYDEGEEGERPSRPIGARGDRLVYSDRSR